VLCGLICCLGCCGEGWANLKRGLPSSPDQSVESDSQKQENKKGAGPRTVDGACLPRVTETATADRDGVGISAAQRSWISRPIGGCPLQPGKDGR
jgi:hypothetical protein